MDDALYRGEAWGGPGQRDQGRQVVGFIVRWSLFRDQPEFQSSRLDRDAMNALFDQIAVRHGARLGTALRRLTTEGFKHQLFDLGSRHAPDAANLVAPLL